MEALMDDNKIKNLFKQAIIEAIEEKKDIVYDLMMEAMEDFAMVRAIEEGEESCRADRDEIFVSLLNFMVASFPRLPGA